MREIKFRAWDKNDKEWIAPALFAVIGTGYLLLYRDGRWKVTDEDIEIVRFTGLHDKNGKEIWEGDVVQVLRNKPRHEENIEVLWMPKGSWNIASAAVIPRCEVIGNIYENPDVLE